MAIGRPACLIDSDRKGVVGAWRLAAIRRMSTMRAVWLMSWRTGEVSV